MKRFSLIPPPIPLHRKRLRADNYDYAGAGLYVVTICAHHMDERFGVVHSGKVELNDAGFLVEKLWNAIPDRHDGVDLDA